jgi:aconitate hydratase
MTAAERNLTMNIARQLIRDHLVDGRMQPGEEIGLKPDQALLQDATGTLSMLMLEAIGIERVSVPLTVQYVDHNLIQADSRNPEDHVYLETASRRFGIWFSRPGNGISHPVHMEAFGVPGALLVGADSHTCAAGSLGMLAIGAGSGDIAAVLAGEPLYIRMPVVMGIRLMGTLPEWVSAKDVILEMLRRHGVKGGVGRIIEYYGPGLACLSAMDRHVIANMSAELGATTTVFPSDEATRAFLAAYGRARDWRPLPTPPNADYDYHDEIDLGSLQPLIAKPSSPDNVVPVREVAGEPIYQAYIGSSANPGFRDFAIAARMVEGRQVAPGVSFDINPSTRRVLLDLMQDGLLGALVQAGGRLHQAGCNGCMGMGQAPASGRNSLRTVPRNFPGRSGTKEDSVFLCSPETATASALTGKITDPRDLALVYPNVIVPERGATARDFVSAPLPEEEAKRVSIIRGANIANLPPINPLPDTIEVPILLKLGDDVSTDDICPAGARAMPLRSNVQKISQFCFERIDPTYVSRAQALLPRGHAFIAGQNYGQGSSREHAVLAPRYLGLGIVLARSFARIQLQNLANAGILALRFENDADYARINLDETLVVAGIVSRISDANGVSVTLKASGKQIRARHLMSARQIEIFRAGGLVAYLAAKAKRTRLREASTAAAVQVAAIP